MGTSLLAGSTLLGMTGLLGLFSDWAIRATLVLLIVFGVAALMRRAAAASRHVVWAVGLVSVLVVPIIAVALPWRLNVLPSLGRGEAPAAAITTPATPQVLDRKTVSGPEQATPTLTSVTSSETRAVVTTRLPAELQAQAAASSRVIPQFKPTLLQVVIALWAAVAVVVSLRLLLGLLLAWRLTHRARPLNDPSWSEPLRWAADCLGVRTPVRLLATRDLLIPVTSGLTRPVVMLPEAARSWSDERRRAVLLHELAHVRRWDWTTQLMAHIVCALHWFNPLCWIAAKRLRAECERACDDLVLDAGTQASRYADHLLQIVRTAGRVRAPAGAIPLAQRSEFEGRLLAILEPRMEQRRMKPLAAPLIAVIVLGLSLPLAAMAPRADTRSVSSEDRIEVAGDTDRSSAEEAGGVSLRVLRSVPAAPARSATALVADFGLSDRPITVPVTLEPMSQGRVSDRLTALLVALSDSDAEVRAAALGSIGQLMEGEDVGVDSVQVAALIRALRTDPEPEVRRMAAWALGELEDARAVAALGEALRQDQDAKVRATAAWALGEIESPEAVAALGAALQDDDVEVRRMAIRALGEIESPNAVDMLIPALRDSDAEIRKYAAWALGEIEDARAVDALGVALRDEDPEVRRAAVHALGEIESPAALDALLPALQDSEVDVRKHAAWALGEIEDARAVDALGGVLRDDNAEVRGAAVYALGEIESPTAVDYLLPALQDSDAEVRKRTAWALGEIEDARAVEALGAAVRDEDVEVRRAAIYALGEIESPMSIDVLLPALQDSDAKIRKHAAWALGEIEDPRATDALVAALADDDAAVRRAVIHGLGEIDMRQAPARLMDALQDVDPQVRQAAAHTLSHIGDPLAVPALTAALQDTDVKVRRAALMALADMPNEAAVNALLEALKDDDPQVRKAAAQALGKHD